MVALAPVVQSLRATWVRCIAPDQIIPFWFSNGCDSEIIARRGAPMLKTIELWVQHAGGSPQVVSLAGAPPIPREMFGDAAAQLIDISAAAGFTLRPEDCNRIKTALLRWAFIWSGEVGVVSGSVCVAAPDFEKLPTAFSDSDPEIISALASAPDPKPRLNISLSASL